MKKDTSKNSSGNHRFHKTSENNIDSGYQGLGKKKTDSAVAIPISSVSHHRQINKSPSSSLEIIVAEDNEVSFLILKSQLEKLNANIYHAQNGLEVIELLNSVPDINLILLDVKMPQMNGIEAIRKIRQIKPEIPVIAQSAFADEIDIISLFQAGCDDFISKPIDESLLNSKIKFWNF